MDLNPQMLQFVERLFQGSGNGHMDKNDLLSKAQGMGLPQSVLSHLGGLPEGQVSKQQVQQHVAQAQGSSIEQDIMKML